MTKRYASEILEQESLCYSSSLATVIVSRATPNVLKQLGFFTLEGPTFPSPEISGISLVVLPDQLSVWR